MSEGETGRPDIRQKLVELLTLMKAACISSLSNSSGLSFRFNLNPTCSFSIADTLVTHLKLGTAGPIAISRMVRLHFYCFADRR